MDNIFEAHIGLVYFDWRFTHCDSKISQNFPFILLWMGWAWCRAVYYRPILKLRRTLLPPSSRRLHGHYSDPW